MNHRLLASIENAESVETSKVEKNFGDTVWVKIEESGEQMLRDYYASLGSAPPSLKLDSEGYTEMTLYQVAKIFGAEMHTHPVDLKFKMPVESLASTAVPSLEAGLEYRYLNNVVWVKITRRGEAMLNDYHRRTKRAKRYVMPFLDSERDAEGYVLMRLNQVMEIFGAQMVNGNRELPIEPNFMVTAISPKANYVGEIFPEIVDDERAEIRARIKYVGKVGGYKIGISKVELQN